MDHLTVRTLLVYLPTSLTERTTNMYATKGEGSEARERSEPSGTTFSNSKFTPSRQRNPRHIRLRVTATPSKTGGPAIVTWVIRKGVRHD
jgi:hypothetical protein